MSEQMVRMRVRFRYRGAESHQFADGAVPEGAIITVTQERARQLIADGNAVPIIGGSQKKPAGPSEIQSGNVPDATDGEAAPSASSPAALVSRETIATPPAVAKQTRAGRSSR